MLTLLSEIKFLSNREDFLLVKDTDYGSFRSLENKKDLSSAFASHQYNKCFASAKRDYESRRKLINTPTQKLKASLKHLEEEIKSKKIIFCEWIDEKMFRLMLSDGLLVTIEICLYSGEIKRLNFDKYFLGKLVSDHVCDVIFTRQHIIISYDDENIITFLHLQKPSMNQIIQKISATDPKIFNIVISSTNTSKLKRNITINPNNDILIIWTKSSQNEFFPWRPSKDQDRANLHVYSLNRDKIETSINYWTENSPIEIEFSKFNEKEVRSIEQKISRKGEVTVECIKYNINIEKRKFQRVSVTSIPLETEVACCSFSPDNEKILMSCIDGSIVLYDDHTHQTFLVHASFIPTSIVWHPDSALLAIANERSQLQFFDIALSCIKNQILSEETTPSNILDLSIYFVHQPKLNKLCWAKKPDFNYQRGVFAQLDCFLLLIFDCGIATKKFVGGTGLRRDIHTSGLTNDVLIHMYLSLNQIEKAINVLLSLNWDTYGAMCLLSLHKIANYVFSTPSLEGEDLLERALSSFYIPIKPLCSETESEFGENVDDIARRFFHFLIRCKSFEKAFRLAIDLNDKDLFVLLQKSTKACGLKDLMNEAKRRADEIYSKEEEEECESHHSSCSMTSCSICSEASCESESDDEPSTSYKRELIQPASLIKSSTTSQTCPPLPKFTNISEQHSNEKISYPPLPALTSHNLKKFNTVLSSSDLGNILPCGSRASSSVPNQNEFTATDPSSYISTSKTKVHNYPLITTSIPSHHVVNQAYFNVTPSTAFKREQTFPVNSILTNVSSGTRKESGEKNKVKFSDTITIAMVPEISRKEKINNFSDKAKRKSFSSPDWDTVDLVKRELKESLPICNPEAYLSNFLPAGKRSSDEKKDKPSIKVVNFGIL